MDINQEKRSTFNLQRRISEVGSFTPENWSPQK